jgi:hypothetical protein
MISRRELADIGSPGGREVVIKVRRPMSGLILDPRTTRPPLPPPFWQWLCMVAVIAMVVTIWLLWR